VLPRASQIPDVVTAGGPTVGVRWPSHPLIQAVIRACDFPLAAPSANPASQVSPTNAEHVRKFFSAKIPLIVDGGQAQVGIESTVLDVSTAPPRLLRPGVIYEEALVAVVGKLAVGAGQSEEVLRSPGLLRKHYSPRAKLAILSWRDDADLRQQIAARLSLITRHPTLSTCHIIAHTRIPSSAGFGRVSVIPHDAEAFARAIYAELHQCDEAGAACIIVEALPETIEWRAVADRLKRAAASEGSESRT
jgi:L-threonylcarbamoyladenylate synthase